MTVSILQPAAIPIDMALLGMPHLGTKLFPMTEGLPANELLIKFYMCPRALNLIQKVLKYTPLTLQVLDSKRNSYHTAYTSPVESLDGKDSGYLISIPTSYSKENRFSALIMELFNTKGFKELNKVIQRAENGELSRERYAFSIEKIEYKNKKKKNSVYDECKDTWGLKSLDDIPSKDFTEYLLGQLSRGHTDFIRREWYKNYKTTYCNKHPEDRDSCDRPITDFVDANSLEEGPEKEKILYDRQVKYLRDDATPRFKENVQKVIARWDREGLKEGL